MSEQVELFRDKQEQVPVEDGGTLFHGEQEHFLQERERAKSVYKRAKRVCAALGLDIEVVIAERLLEWMDGLAMAARR